MLVKVTDADTGEVIVADLQEVFGDDVDECVAVVNQFVAGQSVAALGGGAAPLYWVERV